ncbi:MAG: ATP-binding protein [Vicinamibacterales bacterium]
MDGHVIPNPLRVYILLVVVAAIAVATLSGPFHVTRPGLYACLFTLTLLSSGLRVQVPLHRGWANMAPSHAFTFASLLLFGTGPTVPMAAAGAVMQSTAFGRRWRPAVRHVFNTAAIVLTVAAVALVYRATRDGSVVPESARAWVSLVAAATTYFLVNSWMVATAVALSTGQRLGRCWRESFLWTAPAYYLSAGLAALAATLIEGHYYGSALLIGVPLLLIHHSYQEYLTRLKRDRQELLITLRSIHEALITTDLRGTIELVNEPAAALLGRSVDELEGRALDAVMHVHDRGALARRVDPVTAILTTNTLPSDVLSLHAANGLVRVVELRGTALADRDGPRFGVLLVIRDLTDQLRREQERLRTTRLESVSVLAGGIAHDFNNVLTAIAGELGELSELGPGSEHAGTNPALSRIESACARARSLTHQLFTLSRGASAIREPLRIEALIRQAVEDALMGGPVEARVLIDGDLWAADIDAAQIERVIGNVTLNAAQASPPGTAITVSGRNLALDEASAPAGVPPGHYLEIAVGDGGAGIHRGHLARVFEPSFSTKAYGTGLGLAASHAIVTAHGGHITVESESGAGTSVRIFLPRSAAPSSMVATYRRRAAEADRLVPAPVAPELDVDVAP